MIKRIFLYMALMMSFAACSDDIFDAPRETVPENGEIPVSFVMPDMVATQTRAGETILPNHLDGKVNMLIYNSQTGKLIKDGAVSLDISDGKTVTITIPKEERKNKNLYFLFYANASEPVSGFAENEDIGNHKAKSVPVFSDISATNTNQKIAVSGAASLRDLLQLNTVALRRNCAKVTVSSWQNADTDPVSYYPFQVTGTSAEDPYLFAGICETTNPADKGMLKSAMVNAVPSAFNNSTNLNKDVYVHPTNNTGDDSNRASYVMVKAQATGATGDDKPWYYYRLDFQDEDGKTLDILPNHHYDVRIKADRITAGYATPAEAAKNPIPLSSEMYVIFDHSPQIYNIITDGVRALGVPHKLSYSGAGNETENLYVKVFSKKAATHAVTDPEYKDFQDHFKEYIVFSQTSWLELPESISPVSSDDPEASKIFGSQGSSVIGQAPTEDGKTVKDGDTEGLIFRIPVRFTGAASGNKSCVATISWKGLSREVDVEWKSEFDPSQMFEGAGVTFSGGSYAISSPSTDDYFTFLAGKKESDGSVTLPDVWGADETSNNGYARNDGLHFPMPYGENEASGKNATAIYTVKLKDLAPGQTYQWSYKIVGDPVFSNPGNVVVSEANTGTDISGDTHPTFKITLRNGGWDYGVGTMQIMVKGKVVASINLYHTGFFHKDYADNLASNSTYKPSTERTWTYYEVVTMGGLHWLDRNVGAHSAEMYVEGDGDQTYAGNRAAAGGYYHAADYNKGGKPTMRDKVCPPGFDYPTKDEFDAMRNSSNFSMPSVSGYYDAVYAADSYDQGRKQKMVHFPKSRYLDSNNAKGGESRAGYYWTSTPSSGLEKEEVGAWLNCFSLTGAISTYMNGEVYCSSTSTEGNSTRKGQINGNSMSVRCVAKAGRQDLPTSRTSFFVTGATHVFLYTMDNGEMTPLTDWPGYSICTHEYANKTFNFSYESKTNTSGKLYAIFNYKGENGVIQTISRNATNEDAEESESDKTARWSDNLGADQLVGFKVTGGVAPDMEDYGNETKATALGVTWSFLFTGNSSSEGGIGSTGPTTRTIAYTNPENWSSVKVYYKNKSTDAWSIATMTTDGSNKRYDLPIKATTIRFVNGSVSDADASLNKNRTADITVVQADYHLYDNEPIEPTPSKTYVIYYPTKLGNEDTEQLYMWFEGQNAFVGTKDKTQSDITGYYYQEFTHKGDENLDIKYSLKSDKDMHFTLGEFQKIGDKYYAYIGSDGNGYPGKPGGSTQTDTYYYRINVTGNQNDAFGYGIHDMTESGGKWVLSNLNSPKGNFKIEKCKKSGNTVTVVETIGSTKPNNNSTVNKDQQHPTKKDGDEFWIEQTGNCTLTFDPSANIIVLTVDGGGTATSITIYFNNNWNKSSFRIHYWIDSNNPITTWGTDGKSLPQMTWVKDNWYKYEIPRTDVEAFLIRYNDTTNTADYTDLQSDIATYGYVLRYEFVYSDSRERVQCLGGGAP